MRIIAALLIILLSASGHARAQLGGGGLGPDPSLDSTPVRRFTVQGTIFQVIPDKGVLVQTYVNGEPSILIFLAGYSNQPFEGKQISVRAADAGTYEYTDTSGASRTVNAYQM